MVDALFANAGINGFAPFESTSKELFDQVFTVNTKGPFFTVQLAPLIAALRALEKGGVRGKIVTGVCPRESSVGMSISGSSTARMWASVVV